MANIGLRTAKKAGTLPLVVPYSLGGEAGSTRGYMTKSKKVSALAAALIFASAAPVAAQTTTPTEAVTTTDTGDRDDDSGKWGLLGLLGLAGLLGLKRRDTHRQDNRSNTCTMR